ncbi:MarR family winged helix-turn-helix transcriptional regulator [Lentilactobacillus hilgardii]|uniref:Transcriptional regulator, MarR family n=1 Tax=Lentilactobacillus hilgardii (strain ATCC 8290 / DSM 20176 / CCUG 30140 / JCM 1155 / KCTC 3500 / NBRC 15886 / NCIMB 8040 / NRRL B-1843 / 9) TaxID=1423757 RepID=C0XIS7_LENH9|nr:MarR family winged helix-turn-helix transcriptional regulator [Lentilactobacillus hilgardii]EEI24738.1 transcriptional regulator, MarR family [Lentilactobacillus hilgardii DSM 20176 = ATCC 8290]MCP9333494.1 winged helix-turn-helix transcriptional regulator [Lentilactobacillus hilgardii]MCP9350071.1 winged helix-turn-helix transcriptional regulator [Lentilactobacillus hilgardii]MCP9352963.1 winged helix-turn-helix transcriptional regulator [Lentilactobacillus hilgardii]QEU37534.1 winged heli
MFERIKTLKDIGYLAQDISILHRQYYKDTGELFKKHQLNPTAACILLTIKDNQYINQNQVAKSLVIDKGLAAREIKKMQNLGYLTKTAGVGKSIILNLTDTGQKIVPVIQNIRKQWWETRFSETGIKPDSPLISAIEKVVNSIVSESLE